MLDRYWLRHEDADKPIGLLSIDIDADLFGIEVNPEYDGPLPFFLRCSAPMPLDKRIKMWVLGRAPETNYEFIDVLIEKAGLKEYDAYGFFKYNSGHFITDRFYVEKAEPTE